MTFERALANTIEVNLGNNFDDNYDYYRFGKVNEPIKDGVFGIFSLSKLVRKGIFSRPGIRLMLIKHKHLIEKFEYLYNLLADEVSKELLVKILVYRILGYKKVKLNTNNDTFWQSILFLENIEDKDNFIDIDFENWRLYLFDLAQIGWPIKIYNLASGIYITFVLKQYYYNSPGAMVAVEKDDIVIDAGGGWGDSALSFAYQSGKNGKVYSFEFIPGNIAMMRKNIKLNPELEDRIKIAQNALWSESGKSLYCHDNGPGSSINRERNEYYNTEVKVVSIDDFVASNELSKVDFIKMDIEGSELPALKGAENTLRKYKPKLAISLYHKPEDFRDIPEFIKSLDLGYEFHLDHYTIHAEETVLYAIAQNVKQQ